MSRDQALAATSRLYPGVSPDQALRAAEQVFRLADEADFTFGHAPTSLNARRRWLVYVVIGATMGHDHWQVTAEQTPNGTRLSASVATTYQDINVLTVTPTVSVPMTMPANSDLVAGDAIYDVFFARVDYMLGLRSNWMSCSESNDRVSRKVVNGDNSALCNFANMSDRAPTAPLYAAPAGGRVTPIPSAAAPAPITVPEPAPQSQPAPIVGKDSFVAERLARELNCTREGSAKLVGQGPGYETYSFQCANRETLVMRCEFGNCRALR